MTALRRNMLACPELKRLDPLLARHRLTEAETGQVVLSALKVELSKVCVWLQGAYCLPAKYFRVHVVDLWRAVRSRVVSCTK